MEVCVLSMSPGKIYAANSEYCSIALHDHSDELCSLPSFLQPSSYPAHSSPLWVAAHLSYLDHVNTDSRAISQNIFYILSNNIAYQTWNVDAQDSCLRFDY